MEDQKIKDPRISGIEGLKSELRNPLTKAIREGSSGYNRYKTTGLANFEPVEYLGDREEYQDVGNSTYDKDVRTLAELNEINDFRAQEQPWYLQIGAGVAKGAVLAATTFANGTIGLVWGIGTAIADQRWSGIWDNDFTRAMDSVEKAAEEFMPNYYSNDELNNAWYQNIFTSNFWGDKFIKNLGFTIGAAYSGGVWASGGRALIGGLGKTMKLVSATSKSPAIIAKTAGATLSAVNEGSKEALSAANEWYDPLAKERTERFNKEKEEIEREFQNSKSLREQQQDLWDEKYKDAFDKLNQEYEAVRQNSSFMAGENGVSPAKALLAEHQQKVEALRQSFLQESAQLNSSGIGSQRAAAIRDAKLKAAQASYEEDMAKLNEDRAKLGNRVLLANVPLLAGTNYVTFGKYYARGYNTARHVGNNVRREGNQYVGKKFNKAWAAVGTPAREGGEEGAQFGISFAAKDYYDTDIANYYRKKEDPDAEELTQSWLNSSMKAIVETATNPESQEQIFVGGLTGLLGAPMIRRENGKLKFELNGNVRSQFKEQAEKEARYQEIADYLNKRTVDKKEFQNYYYGMNGHNFYQMQMDDAEERGDAFEFKNAEHNQFVNDVAMFDNAGKMQDFFTLLDEIHDTSDENLAAIIENTTSIVDGKLVGPYAEYATLEDGKIVPNIGNEENKQKMIADLNKNKEELVNKAKEYLKIKNDLDIQTGEMLTDEQLTELTWMKSNIENWRKRATEVSGGVQNYMSSILGILNKSLSFKEALYNQSVSTAKQDAEGKADYSLTEDELALEEEIKKNKQSIGFFEMLKNASPESLASMLGSSPGLVEDLKRELDKLDEDIVNTYQIDREKTKQEIDDIVKLYTAGQRFNEKLTEYLSRPESMEEDAAKVKAEDDKKAAAKNKLNTVEKIRNSKVSDLTNDEDFDPESSELQELAEEFDDIRPTLNKAKEVKNAKEQAKKAIRTTQVDNSEDPTLNQVIKDMADASLERAFKSAQSEEELFDFESEAWLDPQNLPIPDGINPEDMDGIMDEMKTFMEKVKANVLEAKYVMGNTPTSTPTAEAPKEDKAHDSGTSVESENEREEKAQRARAAEAEDKKAAEAFNRKIAEVSQDFSPLIKSSFSEEANKILTALEYARKQELGLDAVVESPPYTNIPENFLPYIDAAIEAYREALVTPAPTNIETSNAEANTEEPAEERGVPTPTTPTTGELGIVSQTNDNPEGKDAATRFYMYWRRSTSRIPIHFVKGKQTPYYQLLINKLPEEQRVNLHPDLRRMKAVWEYLNKHGAFDRCDNDQVKPNMLVRFKIDSELNEAAGVTENNPIILLVDSDGNIIGDMIHESESTFKDYAGLGKIVEELKKAYKAGKVDRNTGIIEGFSTRVDKTMEGNVPYSEEVRTLNEITQGNPLLLGLAMTSGTNPSMMVEGGRTKGTKGDLDNRTSKPLKAKAGQPFMLIGTSKRNINGQTMYRPVPISMPFYTGRGTSKLDNMIMQTFALIFNPSASDIAIKDRLLDLLALKDCWIERVADTNEIRVRLELQNGRQLRRVFQPQNDLNKVREETIRLINDMLNIGEVSYQVSRKYINGNIDGQPYNSLIGELATCNLPVGTTHTVSDWFTLKITEGKTQSPKTTGINPNSNKPRHNQDQSTVNELAIDYKGQAYKVSLEDWQVRDAEGNIYDQNNVEANLLRAFAFGVSKDLIAAGESYMTNWGYYDSVSNKFKQAPKEEIQPVSEEEEELAANFDSIAAAMAGARNQGAEEPSSDEEDIPITEETIDKLEAARVKAAKLLDKKNVVDVLVDDGEFTVTLSFPEYPHLWAFIKFDGHKWSFVVNEKKGERSLLSKEEKQISDNPFDNPLFNKREEFINSIVPKDLQDYFASGKYEEDDKKAVKFGDQLAENFPELSLKDRIDILNHSPQGINIGAGNVLRDNWGIYSFYGSDNNFLREGEGEEEDLSDDDFLADNFDSIAQTRAAAAQQQAQGQPASDESPDNRTSEECYKVVEDRVEQDLWNSLGINAQRALTRLSETDEMTFNRKLRVLEEAFDGDSIDTDELDGASSVEDFLNPPKHRMVTEDIDEVWDQEKEMAWIQRVLPHLSRAEVIRIHRGLIKVANTGRQSYGRFWDGIITIADTAAPGTLYHEAFHAVANTLLSNEEYANLFKEAREKWGDMSNFELEENLAEDFRKYVQIEEIPVLGKFVKLYRSLKNMVNSLFNNRRYIDKVFYDICRGKYANPTVNYRRNTNPLYRISEDITYQEHMIELLNKKTDYRSLSKGIYAARKRAIDTYKTTKVKTNGKFNYFLNIDISLNSETAVKDAIANLGLSDFTYAGINSRTGQWQVFLTPLNELNSAIKYIYETQERERKARLKECEQILQQLNKYKEKTLSEEQLQEQEGDWEIERYFAYQWGNLSAERAKALKEAGISRKEYEEMNIEEKDRFFVCRGLGY